MRGAHIQERSTNHSLLRPAAKGDCTPGAMVKNGMPTFQVTWTFGPGAVVSNSGTITIDGDTASITDLPEHAGNTTRVGILPVETSARP
jgi:hypothetical protein